MPEHVEALQELRVLTRLIEQGRLPVGDEGSRGIDDEFRDLIGHVVNTSQGILSGKGAMQNTVADLDVLIRDHMAPRFESGEFDGRFYIATVYVPGRNVGSLLEELGPLPVRRAVGIIRQLMDVLDFTHHQGYVHRDIKPANLMVTNVGEMDVIKLTDFGSAKVYQSMRSSGLTFEGEMGGSFAFAAPEQITDFRSVQPTSDLYSVAATLYTLIKNQHVDDLPKTVSGIVLKLLREDPVPIQTRGVNLPAAIASLIHRGLARHPEQRFASVKEMRNSLLHFLWRTPAAARSCKRRQGRQWLGKSSVRTWLHAVDSAQ